jgi:tetratricopeptide (TPR) repeat protein
MTATSAPRESSSPKVGRDLQYEVGRRETEVFARFSSGKRVAVARGRERAYPGLTSTAPSTLAFYQMFAPLVAGKHVIDAGAGAGAGARVLREHAAHVSALDSDARALEFAREYAPSAEFIQADLCHGPPLDRADAAVVVDVLGHLARPEAALRGLRACLPVGAQLLVAEAKAYPSQHLSAPARRAFSEAALVALLLRSGFELDEVKSSNSNFVVLVARRSEDPNLDALVEGFHQAGRGRLAAARVEFSRALCSERANVLLEARLGEAEAAFALNDGDGAVSSYFAANELNAEDGRALSGLSRITLAAGEPRDALGLALDALKRDPTESSAHAVMALSAEQIEHPDAFNAWRMAANLAPGAAEVAIGLARVSASRQNYAFAIHAMERLRSYGGPLAVDFHVTLGWLLLADGRRNDASVEARYAAALAPELEAVAELAEAVAVTSV